MKHTKHHVISSAGGFVTATPISWMNRGMKYTQGVGLKQSVLTWVLVNLMLQSVSGMCWTVNIILCLFWRINQVCVCVSCLSSQGLHTTGLQDSDIWESAARPSRHNNTHFNSLKRHPSVQLRPQGLIWEEQTNHLADRRHQPFTIKRKHNIQLWQQQQEVRWYLRASDDPNILFLQQHKCLNIMSGHNCYLWNGMSFIVLPLQCMQGKIHLLLMQNTII